MKTIAAQIRERILTVKPELLKIPAETAGIKKTPESWSKKEIIGHLIDSASNNHQRFVRGAMNLAADFPAYDQNHWVQVQQHNTMDWVELVELFCGYNLHLCSILANLPEDVLRQKELHPDAEVMAHPECNGAVLELADAVLSTSGMLRYARESKAKEFIVVTEVGMIYPLKKENPDKEFYPASDLAICSNMKRITLNSVVRSLEDMIYQVELSDNIISRARKSIERMVNCTGQRQKPVILTEHKDNDKTKSLS